MENLETKELQQNWDSTGRPPKALNPFFIEAMEKVLEHNPSSGDVPVVLLSNDAILTETNELLPEHQKASPSAFDFAMSKIKSEDNTNPEIILYVKRFQSLYKKALIRQEKYLLERLQEDENKRQKRAWILERKFKEWNLKHITEHKEHKTIEHKYNITIVQPVLPKGQDILDSVEVIDGDKQAIEPKQAIDSLIPVGY